MTVKEKIQSINLKLLTPVPEKNHLCLTLDDLNVYNRKHNKN